LWQTFDRRVLIQDYEVGHRYSKVRLDNHGETAFTNYDYQQVGAKGNRCPQQNSMLEGWPDA